jgi:phage terminase large subunit-like protein
VITTGRLQHGNGVCYEQRAYAIKVLEGVFEADHVFGIVFTLDEGDDPYDEKNWPKANPMPGTPKLQKMREYARTRRPAPRPRATSRPRT